MKKITYLMLPFLCIGSSLLKAQTTFNYTGAVQTYTVPTCVYSISVDVKGAEGGISQGGCKGGKGGRVQANLQVTPGQVLNIYVGQNPAANAAGWNGGGAGGADGGGGGGASDIRIGGTALSNRVIVAGGGGGGAQLITSTNYWGGPGGDLNGGDGWYNGTQGGGYPGKGGSQDAGGLGGTSTVSGTAGDLGIGGKGGETHAGGGGAGYYGGGGGASYGNGGAGGGGGSSYTILGTTEIIHTKGFKTGIGEIIIAATIPGPGKPDSILIPDSICINSKVFFSVNPVLGVDYYSWTFPTGTTILSGDSTNMVEVKIGDSSGVVSVTATNACGTSLAMLDSLEFLDCGIIDDTTSVINNNIDIKLSIFPNPTNDVLYLKINNIHIQQYTLKVMNSLGQLVYRDELVNDFLTEINVSKFPKGMYHLILNGKNFIKAEKLFVQ